MAKTLVIKKKIKPYPIETIVMKENQAPLTGLIVKLVPQGFLIESESMFHVGKEHHVSFTIPVLNVEATAKVKVVKTYDKFESKENGQKNFLAEMHFLGMGKDLTQAIQKFNQSIGEESQ